MKSLISFFVSLFFILSTTVALADNTALDANWVCTTNASTSTVDSDKAADEKMGKTPGSAVDSFNFASANCRDCTAITCVVQQPSADTNGDTNGDTNSDSNGATTE